MPVAQVKKKTKCEKWKCSICRCAARLTKKTQLMCSHVRDWHSTERRMLRLTVKQTTSARNKDLLWQCPLCDEGLVIDPRSRTVREARRRHGAEKRAETLPAGFSRLIKLAGRKRNWQERTCGAVQPSAHGFLAERVREKMEEKFEAGLETTRPSATVKWMF